MQNENAGNPPTTTGVSLISVGGVSQLRANTRASAICNIISTAGLGLCAAISAYCTWFYMRISSLGHAYGWGAIPPAEFPLPPAKIENTFDILADIQTIAFAVGGIAFLVSISKIRGGMEALLGKQAFFYGWGWTIGSIFIPFVFFYRPWVGFAELRRAVRGIASRRRVSLEWKTDGVSGDTLILAATFIAGSLMIRALGMQAGDLAATPNFGIETVDSLLRLMSFETVARLLMLVVLIWYLHSLTRAAKQVAVAAEAAETFT